MTLTLEAGKHYFTRDGRSKGPVEYAGEGHFPWLTRVGDAPDMFYFGNGRTALYDTSPEDLVAEDKFKDVGVEIATIAEAQQAASDLAATVAEQIHPLARDDLRYGVQSTVPQEAQKGRRDDGGKPRYDLIAPEIMEELAKVLTFGAVKYAPRNWEHGMSWGRCFASMMRHAWAWWRGEENDPETGLSHLSHVCCNAMFLLAYSKRGTGTDDRWREQNSRPQK